MTRQKIISNLDTFSIVQAIVAIMVLGAMIYMLVVGKEIPPELWTIVGLVVGFFFGGVSSNIIHAIRGEEI